MTFKSSEVISVRMKSILRGKELEEFFREKYYNLFKECLDIADIEYYPTAVGLLGKALECQVKEYWEKKIKTKTLLKINTSNDGIKEIRKKFSETNHATRIAFLHGDEVSFGRDSNKKKYQLKKKLLTDEDYNELQSISRARNDAFHGCSEDRYREIESKSQSYIDRGAVILAKLEIANKA